MVTRNLVQERNYQNFGGLNTSSAPTNIPPTQCTIASNCNLTSNGSIVKRSGYRPVNGVAWNDNKVRIIKEFVSSLGKKLLVFGTSSNNLSGGVAELSGSAYTSGSFFNEITSLTSNTRPTLLQFKDLMFMFNGSEDFVYDGTTTYSPGLAAPTAAPTLADGAVGYLNTGDYIVGYTYRNSATGAESNMSPLALVSVSSGQHIDVTDVVPGPATADQIRFYRTVANGNQLFYETDVAIGSTTATLGNDAEDADDVIVVNVIAEYDNDLPAKSSIAHLIDNRIFSKTAKNTVSWTKVSDQHGAMPQSQPVENFAECDPNDGDDVVGINDANGIPMVFKTRTFGKLIETATNVYVYKKIADYDCVGHHAICKYGTEVVWLGRNNVYISDSVSVRSIGDDIDATIKAANFTSGDRLSALLVSPLKQARLSIANDITNKVGEADTVIVADFKKPGEVSWTTYDPKATGTDYPGIQAASFGTRTNDDNEVEYLFGNAVGNGFIYQMDYGTGDKVDWSSTKAIWFEFATRWIDFGSDAKKLYKYVNTKGAGSGSTASLFLGAQYQYNGTTVSVDNINLSSGQTLWADGVSYTQKWGSFNWSAAQTIDDNSYMQKKATMARLIYRQTSVGVPFELFGWALYASLGAFK